MSRGVYLGFRCPLVVLRSPLSVLIVRPWWRTPAAFTRTTINGQRMTVSTINGQRSQPHHRRPEVRVVVEALDEVEPAEERLHIRPLHAPPASMDQPHLPEPALPRL